MGGANTRYFSLDPDVFDEVYDIVHDFIDIKLKTIENYKGSYGRKQLSVAYIKNCEYNKYSNKRAEVLVINNRIAERLGLPPCIMETFAPQNKEASNKYGYERIFVRSTSKIAKVVDTRKIWNEAQHVLNEAYSADQFAAIVQAHQHDYVQPYVKMPAFTANKIIKYTNAAYFDMIKGHGHILTEVLFPEVQRFKVWLANSMGPEGKKYKALMNVTVGDLGSPAFTPFDINCKPTHYWIMNYVREHLIAELDKVNGELVYANTDGAIVAYPTGELPNGTKPGEFKIKNSGAIYVYRCRTYWVYQYQKTDGTMETVGSLPDKFKGYVDLPNNKVPVIQINLHDEYGHQYSKLIDVMEVESNEY